MSYCLLCCTHDDMEVLTFNGGFLSWSDSLTFVYLSSVV